MGLGNEWWRFQKQRRGPVDNYPKPLPQMGLKDFVREILDEEDKVKTEELVVFLLVVVNALEERLQSIEEWRGQ